jgi:hypothetical protein
MGRPVGNRPLGKPKRRWENTNKPLKSIMGVDGTDVAQGTDKSRALVTCGFHKMGEFLELPYQLLEMYLHHGIRSAVRPM